LAPWDLSSTPVPDDLHGILLDDVAPNSTAKVGILYAGPAAIDPNYLKWSSATQTKIDVGLATLKSKKFVFARPVIATGTYPEQTI
jgi:hypothetical protein